MLQLNQIFTAKPQNGKYHRGRVTEVQEDNTFAVKMFQFNEITARPTYLDTLLNFPPTRESVFHANIQLKNGKWSFCPPKPKLKTFQTPILINVHENFKWIYDGEILFGKVKRISNDPATGLPLIDVALNDNPTRIRVFIYKNNEWTRHNLNEATQKYEELLPKVTGHASDADVARIFRQEMSVHYAQGGSYT